MHPQLKEWFPLFPLPLAIFVPECKQEKSFWGSGEIPTFPVEFCPILRFINSQWERTTMLLHTKLQIYQRKNKYKYVPTSLINFQNKTHFSCCRALSLSSLSFCSFSSNVFFTCLTWFSRVPIRSPLSFHFWSRFLKIHGDILEQIKSIIGNFLIRSVWGEG